MLTVYLRRLRDYDDDLGRDLPPQPPPPPPPYLLDRLPSLRAGLHAKWQRAQAWYTARLAPGPPGPAQGPEAPGAAGARVLGDYHILSELGRGRFGRVYLAEDDREGRRLVAIKVVPAGPVGEAAGRSFRNEVQALRLLDDDHIVPLWKSDRVGDQLILVLKPVLGETLAERIERTRAPRAESRLGPKWSAELLATLAGALAYAHRPEPAKHRPSIIHGDLTPANILLDRETGKPYLTDFGFAKLLDEGAGASRGGDGTGTPAYMAPEQFDERFGKVGPWTDVWALGVILFELLRTGERPFPADDRDTVRAQVLRNPVPPPSLLSPGSPPQLDAVVRKCLEKDPGLRYASADQLAEDLRCFLGCRPLRHARRARWWEYAWSWARREPWRAGTLLLLTLVVVGTISWVVSAVREAQRRDHDRGVANLRAAQRSGNDLLVLRLIDPLIADDYPDDRRPLTIDRLRALLNARHPDFPAEWRRLRDDPAYRDFTGLLDLLRADDLRSRPDQRAASDELLGAALADGRGLSDADKPYAQALQARSERDIVARLNEAIHLDSGHTRARRALLGARLFTGRFADARVEALVIRQILPDDPLPDFAEAFIALAEADLACTPDRLPPAVQDYLDRAAGRLTGEQAGAVRRLFDRLAALHRRLGTLTAADLHRLDAQGVLAEVRAAATAAAVPTALDVPTVTLLTDALEQFQRAAKLTGAGQSASAVRLLEQARANSPDAMLLALEAGNRLQQAWSVYQLQSPLVALGFGSAGPFRARLREAQALAAACADAPTFMPRAPFRYQARVLAVLADLIELKFADGLPPDLFPRLRDHLQALSADGKRFPASRNEAMDLLLAVATAEPDGLMKRSWPLATEAGRGRYRARKQLVSEDYVRPVIRDWLLDAPDDPHALNAAARMELWVGRWDQAEQYSHRVRAAPPGRAPGSELAQADKVLAEAANGRHSHDPRQPVPIP